MKRNVFLAVFTATLTLSLFAVPVFAKTYARGNADGSIELHHTSSGTHHSYANGSSEVHHSYANGFSGTHHSYANGSSDSHCAYVNGASVTHRGHASSCTEVGCAFSGDSAQTSGLTQEENAKALKQHHAEMHECLAYLQDFGVSYKEEEDAIYYDGKKVRYLFDDLDESSCRNYHLGNGDIDVYTERDKDYKLTGVRIATEKEFQEQTELEEAAVKESIAAEADSAAQSADSQHKQGTTSGTAAVERDASWETAAGDSSQFYKEDSEKSKEYRKAGIVQNKQGCWTWEGKAIHLLMDDDGSLYQNGSSSALKEKIYVYVSRDSKGKITKAEKVTGKELLSKKAAQDV